MTIRPARPADAGAIAAIYAPYVLTGTISFEVEAPDAGVIAARMAAAGDLYPWLVAEEDGTVLAYAYASPFNARGAYRWAVETTIYVAEGGQRRGLGRRLYAALLDGLAAQGFTQAIGRISLPNPGSLALHAALGFAEVGVQKDIGWKAGRWVDVVLWQRALGDGGAPVGPHPLTA